MLSKAPLLLNSTRLDVCENVSIMGGRSVLPSQDKPIFDRINIGSEGVMFLLRLVRTSTVPPDAIFKPTGFVSGSLEKKSVLEAP